MVSRQDVFTLKYDYFKCYNWIIKKLIKLNILGNLGLMVVFVFLANNALARGFEETFVSLMLIYGIIVVLINAFFVARFCKK